MSSLANVLVTNAASAQSGSVIRALLAPDDGRPESVRVLAVTRDATLPAAQELVARYPSDRLELIQSDTRDPAALLAGRPHGSIAAACLFTWPPAEEQQAIPLIDALVAHGVSHVVFWSVDRGGQHQSWDNPTDIESFAEKHRIERHLRDRGGEPDAAFTWTILRPVCFMDNLDMHSFCGIFVSMWSLSLSPHRRLQLIARRDVGVWAAKAIGASLARSPEARRASPYANRAVSLAGDERTLTEVRAIFRRVVGSEPPWSWSILGRMTMWTLPVLSKVFAMYEREGGGVDVAALRAEEPWMLDLETYLRDYSGWKKAGGPTKEKTI